MVVLQSIVDYVRVSYLDYSMLEPAVEVGLLSIAWPPADCYNAKILPP